MEKYPDSKSPYTKEYNDSRSRFEHTIKRSSSVSFRVVGTKSTHRTEYWSSLLFSRMLLMSYTIRDISPNRKTLSKKPKHWDFSSVASLVRNLIECYLLFYHLCIEEMSEEESEMRQILLWIRDNRARWKLTVDFGEDPDQVGYDRSQLVHRKRLGELECFKQFPDKRKKELLKGDKLPYIQDEILEKIGLERNIFRGLYRFYSNFVHTGPISFVRMTDQDRGTGEENKVERQYYSFALQYAAEILEMANQDMVKLHQIRHL